MTTSQDQRVHAPSVLGEDLGRTERWPLPGGGSVLVVRPSAVLSEPAKERVYAALVPVTTNAFGADMTPYWAGRRADGYLDKLDVFAIVCDGEDEFVGWTGYHRLEFSRPVVYWDSTGVVPAWQRTGLMGQVLDAMLLDMIAGYGERRPLVCARSTNPVLYRVFQALLGPRSTYPQPDEPVPATVGTAIGELADWLGQGELFQPDTLTVKGAYAALPALYGARPSSGHRATDEFIYSLVGPADGLLIAATTEELAARAARTAVPAARSGERAGRP